MVRTAVDKNLLEPFNKFVCTAEPHVVHESLLSAFCCHLMLHLRTLTQL